jgi:DegV family protein with EDD domain
MYNSASVAAELAVSTLLDTRIEVLEGATAAAGQGLVAIAAARAAAGGKTLKEVTTLARDIMSRVNLFAALDTLHYLARSGRVPQAAAMVNSLLNIKPVFSLDHGDAHTVALPRTTRSARQRLLKLINEHSVKGQPLHAAVMHADAIEEAEKLKKRITAEFDCAELWLTEFTPVMGAHTGPGLIGVAFYSEA